MHCPVVRKGFPGGSGVKNPLAGDAGDMGLLSESGRSPGGGHGNPLQCSCLGRRLAGYSPGGHKEHAWSGQNDMLGLSWHRNQGKPVAGFFTCIFTTRLWLSLLVSLLESFHTLPPYNIIIFSLRCL